MNGWYLIGWMIRWQNDFKSFADFYRGIGDYKEKLTGID
jgi:hypothetical protein